jgi:putative membrane protein insertion efficiency factor
MKRVLMLIIDTYRWFISPMLHTLVPIRSGCRFTPVCSEYYREAVRQYGVAHGTRLGTRRLLQCHPFGRQQV